MKDIKITGKTIRRELMILVISFIAAIIINIIAIIKYNTSWKELFTQLHIVILLVLVIYFFSGILRFMVYGVRLMIRRLLRVTQIWSTESD